MAKSQAWDRVGSFLVANECKCLDLNAARGRGFIFLFFFKKTNHTGRHYKNDFSGLKKNHSLPTNFIFLLMNISTIGCARARFHVSIAEAEPLFDQKDRFCNVVCCPLENTIVDRDCLPTGHQKSRAMLQVLLPAPRATRGDTFHISLRLHRASPAPRPASATKP